MSQSVLALLNTQLREGAAEFGWTYVGNVATPFLHHGIGAGDMRWIRTYEDSMWYQANETGFVHPTQAGHEAIANAIGAVLHTGFKGLEITPGSVVLKPGETVTLQALPRGDHGPYAYRWNTKQATPWITVTAGPDGTTSTHTVEVTHQVLGKTLTRSMSILSRAEEPEPEECLPAKLCD